MIISQTTEARTGSLYGNLFTAYSQEQFDFSVDLFSKRHRMWASELGFDPEVWFKGKVCLDAGCGGGRFVVALAQLGAGSVVGIDVSEAAVRAANERITERGLRTASAQVASVLQIPFSDQSFDYVISSGVIHHTPDPYRAFCELTRVLKPDGKLFLSVYGRGGLKWFLNDVCRYTICKVIPFPVMEKIWAFFKIPANKRYNMLDNMYVDYCYRYREEEIRKWFTDAGFSNLHRLKFERYDYTTFWSRIIHGEGWIQIYGDKTK